MSKLLDSFPKDLRALLLEEAKEIIEKPKESTRAEIQKDIAAFCKRQVEEAKRFTK